jgi:hypothetical protein
MNLCQQVYEGQSSEWFQQDIPEIMNFIPLFGVPFKRSKMDSVLHMDDVTPKNRPNIFTHVVKNWFKLGLEKHTTTTIR